MNLLYEAKQGVYLQGWLIQNEETAATGKIGLTIAGYVQLDQIFEVLDVRR